MKKEEPKRIKFFVYMSEKFVNTSLDELDLSARSYHCLKRVGYSTIGDVLEDIDTQDDLRKIRNLGANSAKEIMNRIFLYHYNTLPQHKIKPYEEEIKRRNNKSTFTECLIALNVKE